MACWNLIEHKELGGTASTVSFTSIAASYDHLLLLSSARCDHSGTNNSYKFQLNGETAATNYSYTELNASTSTPTSSQYTTEATAGGYVRVPAATATADTFSVTKFWIPNYANTSNFKQVLTQNTMPNASTTNNEWYVKIVAGLWANTDAVDEITLGPLGSGDFVQYSTFTLYGINGAA